LGVVCPFRLLAAPQACFQTVVQTPRDEEEKLKKAEEKKKKEEERERKKKELEEKVLLPLPR
jgi:hypothetical protein